MLLTCGRLPSPVALPPLWWRPLVPLTLPTSAVQLTLMPLPLLALPPTTTVLPTSTVLQAPASLQTQLVAPLLPTLTTLLTCGRLQRLVALPPLSWHASPVETPPSPLPLVLPRSPRPILALPPAPALQPARMPLSLLTLRN